jgi:hypothetical protein
MRWIAISGSWRITNRRVEKDVRRAVAEIFARGNGLVTGGALGVDFIATDEMLRHDPNARRIHIIIPAPIKVFADHFRKRAAEGVITSDQAECLIGQLTDVRHRNPEALTEMSHDVLNERTYYDRNNEILKCADELLAFQVNGSLGVQDTIDKARRLGLDIEVKTYQIETATP